MTLSVRYGVVVCSVMVLLSIIALGHYCMIFADLRLLRSSGLDGVAQALGNQKYFLVRMPRTVGESCGIKTTHPSDFNSCQDLSPVVVVLLSVNQ